MVRLLLTLSPVICTLIGCGYGLVRGPVALRGARTLHVAPFANDTRESGAGPLFARALRHTLAGRAGMRLGDPATADALVTGRIERLDFAPFAYPRAVAGGALVRAGEFRATARLRVVVRRRTSGAILLSTGSLTVTGEYLRGADVLGTESNRERALRQIATDAARRIADLLADSF